MRLIRVFVLIAYHTYHITYHDMYLTYERTLFELLQLVKVKNINSSVSNMCLQTSFSTRFDIFVKIHYAEIASAKYILHKISEARN